MQLDVGVWSPHDHADATRPRANDRGVLHGPRHGVISPNGTPKKTQFDGVSPGNRGGLSPEGAPFPDVSAGAGAASRPILAQPRTPPDTAESRLGRPARRSSTASRPGSPTPRRRHVTHGERRGPSGSGRMTTPPRVFQKTGSPRRRSVVVVVCDRREPLRGDAAVATRRQGRASKGRQGRRGRSRCDGGRRCSVDHHPRIDRRERVMPGRPGTIRHRDHSLDRRFEDEDRRAGAPRAVVNR
jgi:hypothetical protein